MSLKTIKETFFEQIEPFNEKYGFVSKKSQFCIVKKEGNRRIEISLAIYNTWYDEIAFMPYFSIYFEEIEKIAKPCEPGYNKLATLAPRLLDLEVLYDKNAPRCFLEEYPLDKVEEFGIDRKDELSVFFDNEKTDVAKAIAKIEEIYVNYGLKYIEMYGNYEAVHAFYNHDKASNTYHNSAWGFKAIAGITIPKLLNLPEWREIVHEYIEVFKNKEPHNYERHMCLANKLLAV